MVRMRNPLVSVVVVAPGERNADMDIVLIVGLRLQESAWAGAAARLAERGHCPVPVALPGQGDGNRYATLADQVAAVLAAVDWAAGWPMVVGHSAASSLAWLGVDARPGKVARAAFVGAGLPRTASRISTASRPRRAPFSSRAGTSSKDRTPPTWTAPPDGPSRQRLSRFPKGSPARRSGWPTLAVTPSRRY